MESGKGSAVCFEKQITLTPFLIAFLIDADLLDPAMWQVGDFDGDGYDDYRFVAHLSKKGCRTWSTWLWLPDRERFTLGAKIKHQTDANGKSLKVCL